ncbi:hypothetical protein SALBM311S_07709 [Streptomyces alboniger]
MFSALRIRDYRLLASGQLLSSLGDWFLLLAVPYYVLELTGSAMASGFSLAAGTVPALVLGPLAGALVDRWNRLRVMIAADLVRMVAVSLMPRRKDWTAEARGVAGAAAGGQDVVGPGGVVAERDRRPGPDEDRARVAHPVGHQGRVRRLDLQVFGAVRVDHPQALVDPVDQHDRGLPAVQRGEIRSSTCLLAATCGSSSFSTASAMLTESVTSTAAASGSCSA